MEREKCPVCGSEEIEGDSITVEGESAYQEMSCRVCDSYWQAEYARTGHIRYLENNQKCGYKYTLEVR